MSYQALYRRYRPDTFEDVIGEEHITLALKNQVKTGKISHAYLFTGPRGIGKTSCAKILAKAVNCTSPVDGSPCNACPTCKEITNSFDIIEIDAASNNRVDEIRDLREKVKYMPTSAKYKVYIIDEVHMLTDSAYNALLKTLEEPPAHVIFILATTEVHRLPRTILSRCLRFDFKLVGEEELIELVNKIFAQIGKDAESSAVRQIAVSGEGCVRDTLSIADICASGTIGRLTYADVLKVTGATDKRTVIALAKAALEGDADKVFSSIKQLSSAGASFSALTKDLIQTVREVLIVKTCNSYQSILGVSPEIQREIEATATVCDTSRAVLLMDSLTAAEANLRYAASPAAIVEAAIIRTTHGASSVNLEKRVEALEKMGVGKPSAATVWGEVVARLKRREDVLLYSSCAALHGEEISDGKIYVVCDSTVQKTLMQKANKAVIDTILADLGYRLTLETRQPTSDPTATQIDEIKQKLSSTKLIIKD